MVTQSTKRVLAVDDSSLMHRVYEVTLRTYTRCSLTLELAADGAEGLEKLAAHPDTDLVLCDINMPVMTGLEFLERVKADRVLERIPVVLISTEDHRSDIERGLAAGADGYLMKPLQTMQLHGMLNKLLGVKA